MKRYENWGSDDAGDAPLGRRPFMGSVGALGVGGLLAGTTGIAAGDHVGEWPEPDDPYYAGLADELAGMNLPPADFVHGSDETSTSAQYWTESGEYGAVESLDVSGDDVPFAEATRFDVTEAPPNNHDVQMRTAEWASDPYRSVEAGQVMLGVASLRAPEGSGTAQYVADNSQSDAWNSVVSDDYQELDEEWQRYCFPIEFTAAADGEAYEWSTQFHLGFDVQTVDVGGLALLDFGQDVDSSELPSGAVEPPEEDDTDDDTDDSAEWVIPNDPYYGQLARGLEQVGLPPAEFVYAETEADTHATYAVQGSAESESLDVSGDEVPFSEAVHVEVGSDLENPWDAVMIAHVDDRAVSTGDVLLGVAYLRAPDGDATVQYTAKDDPNEATNMVISPEPSVGPEWERYFFPIQFDYDSEPGTWRTEFFLGYPGQTVDVGGLALLDFGQTVDPADLPSWDGDLEVPETWEDAADQRIQTNRTTDLTVQVVNSDAVSIDGAEVSVTQQSHAFGFGTAVDADTLTDQSQTGDEYRERVSSLFSTAVLENRHKWRFFEEQQGLADDATDWIVEQGLDLRGHTCLWANRDADAVPADVEAALDDGDAETVRDRSMEHIDAIVSHYGDAVAEWEVVNEPINEPELIELIDGEDVDPVEAPILAEWYQQARDVAPAGTTLAINEYNTLAGPYEETRADYERQIAFLADQDVGLDSVGLQCHFSSDETLSPAEILAALDRYAAHDVRLRITEFDMSDPDWDEEDKAEYFHTFLKTVFSHEAVDDFVMWGFWDGRHWQDDAPLFDDEWNEKPTYGEYTGLVLEEWWTDETGESDDFGQFETRAFDGDYEITVSYDDLETTVTRTVSGDEQTVNVTLDADADEGNDEDRDDDGDEGNDEDRNDDGDDTDDETDEADTTEPETDTGDDGRPEQESLPGFGIVSGLAGLVGLAGYALSRDEDADR